MSREQELMDLLADYSRNTIDGPKDRPPDYVIDAMKELSEIRAVADPTPPAKAHKGE